MNTDPTRVWIRRASTAAGLAYTAIAEYELGRRLGAQAPIAVMLPMAIDCYVIAALKWFRALDVALSLVLMCSAQIAAHALEAGLVKVNLDLVVVVSVLVPVALWRTHALAHGETVVTPEPQPVTEPVAAPAVAELEPVIEVVPSGARMLPIVSAAVTNEGALEHAEPEPEQVVTRPAVVDGWGSLGWPWLDDSSATEPPAMVTTAAATQAPRQVVTEAVTTTPSELRKLARKLNREAVAETSRPVTIETLRSELGLSRREATDLRREVIGEKRS